MTDIYVALEALFVEDNPRGDIHDTTGLQGSISLVGLLTPLHVRELVDEAGRGEYEVVSGARRLTALKALARDGVPVPNLMYSEIPCILVEQDEEDIPALKLAANLHEDLPPSKVGQYFIETLLAEQWTDVKLARAYGVSTARARLFMLLAQADPTVRKKVDSGEMSLTAFKTLSAASPEVQRETVKTDGKVTVAKAKKAVKDSQSKRQDGFTDFVQDEPSILEILHNVKTALEMVTGMPDLGPREQYVLDQIRQLLE